MRAAHRLATAPSHDRVCAKHSSSIRLPREPSDRTGACDRRARFTQRPNRHDRLVDEGGDDVVSLRLAAVRGRERRMLARLCRGVLACACAVYRRTRRDSATLLPARPARCLRTRIGTYVPARSFNRIIYFVTSILREGVGRPAAAAAERNRRDEFQRLISASPARRELGHHRDRAPVGRRPARFVVSLNTGPDARNAPEEPTRNRGGT